MSSVGPVLGIVYGALALWPETMASWWGAVIIGAVGLVVSTTVHTGLYRLARRRRDRALLGEVNRSDRGLDYPEPVTDKYGSQVTVHTSSAANGPHIWVRIATTRPDMVERNPDGTLEISLHLAGQDGRALQTRLGHVLDSHYQGPVR
ncbi:hypothetical protein D5S17_35490 [Pseudonocardiaceae bacterium YIM PH 21723]|nr:hypothetical protein D5S17_35490 [Pseudonocardiaceae bacterium YIM PH 21723]